VSFSQNGTEEDAGLFQAPAGKRALILSAGSLFNIFFAFVIFTLVFMIGEHLYLHDALLLGAKTVWEILSGTIRFIFNMLTGNGTMEGLSGPVGIAAMAGQAAGHGLLSLLYFTGALSMSLGILNLLPLPALDGGHLVMIFIESVRKRPLSPAAYQVTTLIGLLLFLVLTAAVTFKDVAALIT
jgi:regulator of sigma E protease